MVTDSPLIVLIGPTASGKTSLALHLAEKFNGEIVSCDSVAVYREMEIGTAKPSREERAMIPHHLIDVVSPDEACTAGDYSRLAREALRGIVERGHLPIVAGGTGLYLRALIDGLFPAPPAQTGLRERLRDLASKRGATYLHRILARLDVTAAAAIHSNDVPKVVRAIEVSLAAKEPLTAQWEKGRNALTGFRILRLGLDPPRARLYERINQRAAEMFDRGLAHLARIRRGGGSPTRPAHARRSHRTGPAGPSQLRKTPGHVVPPRARDALAQRLRRRRRDRSGSERLSNKVDRKVEKF
jgi:tRNA dimethylallyltransferase